MGTRGPKVRNILERFEEKVLAENDNGCTIYTGAKYHGGHGAFYMDGKQVHAHRVAYELYVGEIPKDMCVCHKCDVPSCVNPDHLFLGTQADNMQDKLNKGRQLKGSDIKSSKLDESLVSSIKRRLREGARQIDLVRELGVSKQIISSIAVNRTWRHVA